MTTEQIKRLKEVAIYRTTPSFERHKENDSVLCENGFIEMTRHGAKITKEGINKLKELNVL